MKIHQGFENLELRNPVVTLGTFDGFHRGHAMLISSLINRAILINGESVVITFFPHPRHVLSGKGLSPALLNTLEEKIDLIEKSGVDHLIIIEFNSKFSNKEACEFIGEVLVGKIGAKHLIVGFNHHFGRRREGDFNTIQECAAENGLSIEMVEALQWGSGVISSSLIREELLSGKLEDANNLLGYSYFLKGSIVEGRKIGRKIGYPTANICPGNPDKLIPKDGVYAVEIIIDGRNYKGVMSIGMNPTIDLNSSSRSLEVNIFDFGREIYGSEVTVIFRFRLRDEMLFSSLSELASQINIDRERALNLLGRG